MTFTQFLDLPIIKPLVALLRSRKFLVAVLTGVLDAVGSQYPEFAPYRSAVYALGIAVIAGIAYEDGAKAKAGNLPG